MRSLIAAVLVTLALVSVDASGVAAQETADFSGAWTLVERSGGPEGRRMARQGGTDRQGTDRQGTERQGGMQRQGEMGRAGGAGAMGGRMAMVGGFGQAFTIEQTAETLTVVRTTGMGEMRTVYNLDGSESRNRMGMRDAGMEIVSRTAWDGASLVITTPFDFGGNAGEARTTLQLDSEGHLVVETTRTGAPEGRAMRAVYTRD